MLIAFVVFLPFLFACLSCFAGDVFLILSSGMELLLTLPLVFGHAEFTVPGILAGGLSFMTDGFRSVYAVIAAFMWFFTAVFSREYFREEPENLERYRFFVLMTLGATEGVMLSGDFMTSFVFFEILSFTSFTWVIHEETRAAVRAGYTYLFIAVIGGLVLFMGLALLNSTAGTFAFQELPGKISRLSDEPSRRRIFAAAVCILLGFGAKAGMFPLHVWLPKAHPAAPSPASALLSGILTKVGIYGILMTALWLLPADLFFGVLVLTLGLVTMALGAVLALFSVNLKRTLACSSMSQIGFILTGTAMTVLLTAAGEEEGRAMALGGTMLHMVNHSLIKLTLFMAAGAVVMNLHALTLDDIRGWGRNKTGLKAAFALGALGISGVPLFNGYISKTLLHEGIVEGIHVWTEITEESGALAACAAGFTWLPQYLRAAEWIFLCSGGLTFAYMLKLFIAVFVERNRDKERQAAFDASAYSMDRLSTFAVCGSAAAMPLLGQPAVMNRLGTFMTGAFLSGEADLMEFRPFLPGNLKGGMISLGIGAVVYLLFVRRVLLRDGSYVDLWPEKLDLEEGLYRPLLTKFLPAFFGSLASVFGENRVLAPAGRTLTGIPEGRGEGALPAAAAMFGENRILTPLSSGILRTASVLTKVLSGGVDGLVILLRMTLIREVPVHDAERRRAGRLFALREETRAAAEPILRNFTFALLMTCIGILMILGALIYCIAAA